MTYAQGTDVPVDRSKAEIERTIIRYGATQFVSGWQDDGQAMIGFKCRDRSVQFARSPSGRRERCDTERLRCWENACRQRWRALCLVIKAKLEAVESGISCFEDEFLAHIVMPDGKSVSQWIRPKIEQAYKHNRMPQLALPAPIANEEPAA